MHQEAIYHYYLGLLFITITIIIIICFFKLG